MKLLPLVVVLLAGCIESNLIPCGELQCPSDATCHQGACVATVALDACAGIVDGTACTLANTSNSICLSSVCTTVGCGSGVIDPRSHEVCADTNRDNGDGCNADCTSTETCGNGVIDQYKGEACDDGNAINDDDCHNNCQRPSCGDGVVDSRFGEACDDGALNSEQANANCRPNCLLSRCGDGTLDLNEVCDDRNANSGDGCSFDCKSSETCGNNYTDFATGEQCDNATTLAGDGCGQTCENEQLVVEPIAVDPQPIQFCSHDFPARGEYVVFSNVGTVIVGNDGRHVRITQHQPPPRANCMMAYNGTTQKLYLYGGQADPEVRDLWSFDGTDWTLENADGPPARRSAMFEYDAAGNQLILAGGVAANATLRDTWSYRNGAWTNLTATAGFAPQTDGASWMYSTAEQRILLASPDGSSMHFQNNRWAPDGQEVCFIDPDTGEQQCFTLSMSLPIRIGGFMASVGGETFLVGGRTDDCNWFSCAPQLKVLRRQQNVWVDSGINNLTNLVTSVQRGASVFALNNLLTPEYALSVGVNATLVFTDVPDPGIVSEMTATYVPALGKTFYWGGFENHGDTFTVNENTWFSDGTGWRLGPVLTDFCDSAIAMGMEPRVALACNGQLYYVTHNTLAIGPLAPSSTIVFDDSRQTIVAWVNDHLEMLNGDSWQMIPGSQGLPPTLGKPWLLYFQGSIHAAANVGGGVYVAKFDGDAWVALNTLGLAGRTLDSVTLDATRYALVATLRNGYALEPAVASFDGSVWRRAAYPGAPQTIQTYDSRNAMLLSGQPNFVGIVLRQIDPARLREACEDATVDSDGDGQMGCADPDCWWRCDPSCPPRAPAATCAIGRARCGDGVCSSELENPAICPLDCSMYAVSE